MPLVEQINDTTYEATLLGGDKVEIGDRGSVDFKPHLKLNRWDGECFIKVSLPTSRKITPVVEGEKVKWVTQGVEVHLYSLEPTTIIAKDKDGNDAESTQNELGGFEFEIILKKKPVSNKIVLDIETEGFKFYYQPALTQQEIDDGVVRPDNVIGSYAVYHATRTNVHKSKADAEKYRCGIAFHIYRPKVTDANGDWVWARQNIDEQVGTLTITIDQTWLDSAVYPVTIDPNFGYETAGASWWTGADTIRGSLFTSPGDVGAGVSISMYGVDYSNDGYWKGLIVLHSTLVIIADGITTGAAITGTKTWWTGTFSTGPTLSPSTEYVLAIIFDSGDVRVYLNTGAADQGHMDTSNNYASPTDPTDATHGTHLNSIYCTYEVEAGVDYPISLSVGLTASATIDRDVTWGRTLSPGLTVSATIAAVFGRLITTTAGLIANTTISRQVAWDRGTTTNLTTAVSILKGWGRKITTVAGLTVSAIVTVQTGWKIALSPGLTISATVVKGWGRTIATSANLTISTAISRVVAYNRAVSAGLTVAVTILKGWGRAIATTTDLVISATVVKGWGRLVATSPGLTVSATVVKSWGRTISTSAGLTASATISRVLAYTRATSAAGLSLSATIIATLVAGLPAFLTVKVYFSSRFPKSYVEIFRGLIALGSSKIVKAITRTRR